MRAKTLIMLGLALVFGTMAVLVGQRWLDQQSRQRLSEVRVAEPPPTRTVVVAALPFKFGTEITRQHLREIAWPAGAVPKGAFASIAEILDGKTRRVALSAVEENEPVLASKVTGPGQRATLTALIEPGLKAATIRVNDVNGVAGFVLPGERVDVLVTRMLEHGEGYTDVLLQNMKVLAVDQSADERADKPSLVKAVTLEATTEQTQRLTLAATVGSLSLTLRAAGAEHREATQRIAVADLSHGPTTLAQLPVAQTPVAYAALPAAPEPRRAVTVGVTRGMKRQEYSVPVNAGPELPQLGTASVESR